MNGGIQFFIVVFPSDVFDLLLLAKRKTILIDHSLFFAEGPGGPTNHF